MIPELGGGSVARNGARPVKAGSTSVPSRAADRAAVWNSAARTASSASPMYAVWKLPLCQTLPPAASISGFSAAAFSSMVTARSAPRAASIAGPCTCGNARYPYGSWIRAGGGPSSASSPRSTAATSRCPG
jgi:hypothetical protein